MVSLDRKKSTKINYATRNAEEFDNIFSELKENLLQEVRQGKKLSDKELIERIRPFVNAAETSFHIPVSIFHNNLSTLECLVTYLVVYKEMRFYEIAHLLNRDQRTIWGAFTRAKRKKISIVVEESEIKIPSSIFAERSKSPLYALVGCLIDNFSLNYSQTARLLNLDPRTIWTVYHKK